MILLLPTMRAGFFDSFNPGGLAMLLWFGIHLFDVWQRNGRIKQQGLWFIAGVFIVRFLFGFCVLDRLVFSRGFDIFLDVTYFVFAIGAIITGALFWRRWGILRRKTDNEAVPLFLPVMQRILDGVRPGIGRLKQFCCRPKVCVWRYCPVPRGSFGLGIFLGLMQTAWVPDVYVTQTLTALPFLDNWPEWCKLLSIYSLSFVAMLFFMLFVFVQLTKSAFFVDRLKRAQSLVNVIMAAVFLGYGLSFLSFYF